MIKRLLGSGQGSKLASNESLWPNGLLDQNETFSYSGFGVISGGGNYNGAFGDSNGAYLWSSSEFNSGNSLASGLKYDNSQIQRYYFNNQLFSFSVRYIKD